MRLSSCGLQVPPDFYIPDFDEDEQNPDERIDRKKIRSLYILILYIAATLRFSISPKEATPTDAHTCPFSPPLLCGIFS